MTTNPQTGDLPLLPGDEDLASLLDYTANPPPPDAQYHLDTDGEFNAMLARDRTRLMLSVGRAMARLRAQHGAVEEYRERLVAECHEMLAPIDSQIRFLDNQLRNLAIEARERSGEKHIDIPGIGRYSTRTVAAGWDVPTTKADEDAMLHAFDADEYTMVTEMRTVVVPAKVRELLDAMLATSVGDERMAHEPVEDIAQSLAETYHVGRRPAGVSVSFKASGGGA